MARSDDAGARDASLARLFEEQYEPLRRLAFFILGDAAHAEEMVMDVFARALTRWSLFRSVEDPVPYLRRSVVNACRTRARRNALEQRFAFRSRKRDEADEAAALELRGELLDLWRALSTLPERQRTCVVLRYVEDLPEADIARLMDAPVGTVKSLLSRARARLSRALDMDVEVSSGDR